MDVRNNHPVVSCPACDGTNHDLIDTCNGYSILICNGCKLIFSDPMQGGDSSYYKNHIAYCETDSNMIAQHCRSAEKAANRRLLDMLPNNDLHNKLLDIGCGFGAFVQFSIKKGYDAYGVDFNNEQIGIGRSILGLGDRLLHGEITELRDKICKMGPFDLITMFEVIEHIENPRKLIQDIYGFLKVGGLLAVSCPNESRWQPTGRIFVDYPPHHLTRWLPDTLKRFMENQGFSHVLTEVESSFRDLLWIVYVNNRVKRKITLKVEHPMKSELTSNTTARKTKVVVFDLLKVGCVPFDLLLKLAGVGTMGMRMIFKKT